MQNNIKEKILESAISLESFGMYELAWTQDKAIKLIETIMHDEIGILGGDVYNIIDGKPKPTYDNWYCEPMSGESNSDFFLRSKIESLKYINEYFVDLNETFIFSLTFTEMM